VGGLLSAEFAFDFADVLRIKKEKKIL